ncbi:MAG TPA: rod shape-determining protein MreD [Patescibacteria group bacterium]|nr:rod shape-determining protein MreD [Patescibacteria group bacterium]
MRGILYVPFIILLGLFQVSVLDICKVWNVKPDLLLVGMAACGVYTSSAWALSLGLLAGLWKDIFSAGPFGVNTLLFSLWSLALVKLARKISIDNYIIFAGTIAVITALDAILTRLVFLYFGKVVSLGIFLRILVLETAYTAAASVPLFSLAKMIHEKSR